MSQTTYAVIAELMDRRLLNDVDDDLHQEIAEAVIQAARLSRSDHRGAVEEALDITRNALVVMRARLRTEPTVQGREWIDLGIVVNDAIEEADKALSPPSGGDEAKESEGGTFQSRVQPWMMACFGPEISADRTERNHRFLEEALELVQSNGCTPDEAHQLVDYVYGRPQGEINQEVGGVMVTLAALCLANGIDMHKGGETELARVWTKVEQIRAKQAAKPKHSPLPGPSEPLVGRREEQLRIQALGAAISRRDWHAAERAYEIIRDKFDRPSEPSPPTDRREIVAWFKDRIDKYETQLNATGQADVAHLLRRDAQIILAALDGGRDA